MEGRRRQLQQTAVTAGPAVHGQALLQLKGNRTSATPLEESRLVSAGRFFSVSSYTRGGGGVLIPSSDFSVQLYLP